MPKTKQDKEKTILKKTKEPKEVKELVSLIISPRLTEKASDLSSSNIYTFNVKESADKISLAKEIQRTYKVKPLKITIINHPRKTVFIKNKLGFKPSFKKAQVVLKKGDKIVLS